MGLIDKLGKAAVIITALGAAAASYIGISPNNVHADQQIGNKIFDQYGGLLARVEREITGNIEILTYFNDKKKPIWKEIICYDPENDETHTTNFGDNGDRDDNQQDKKTKTVKDSKGRIIKRNTYDLDQPNANKETGNIMSANITYTETIKELTSTEIRTEFTKSKINQKYIKTQYTINTEYYNKNPKRPKIIIKKIRDKDKEIRLISIDEDGTEIINIEENTNGKLKYYIQKTTFDENGNPTETNIFETNSKYEIQNKTFSCGYSNVIKGLVNKFTRWVFGRNGLEEKIENERGEIFNIIDKDTQVTELETKSGWDTKKSIYDIKSRKTIHSKQSEKYIQDKLSEYKEILKKYNPQSPENQLPKEAKNLKTLAEIIEDEDRTYLVFTNNAQPRGIFDNPKDKKKFGFQTFGVTLNNDDIINITKCNPGGYIDYQTNIDNGNKTSITWQFLEDDLVFRIDDKEGKLINGYIIDSPIHRSGEPIIKIGIFDNYAPEGPQKYPFADRFIELNFDTGLKNITSSKGIKQGKNKDLIDFLFYVLPTLNLNQEEWDIIKQDKAYFPNPMKPNEIFLNKAIKHPEYKIDITADFFKFHKFIQENCTEKR